VRDLAKALKAASTNQDKEAILNEWLLVKAASTNQDKEAILNEWLLELLVKTDLPTSDKSKPPRPDLIKKNKERKILNKGIVWLLWQYFKSENPNLPKKSIDFIVLEKYNAVLDEKEKVSYYAIKKIRLEWEKVLKEREYF
jgi:hypothetical protein